MVKYMGRTFKNYEALKEWNKQGHIDHYKQLAKMAATNLTMELSIMMGEAADTLHNHFGMEWSEIEEIEIAAMQTA